MLRSQSISNIQPERKSNSFLNSFRLTSSDKKPAAATATERTPAPTRKHRPLSQSFSSINLHQKYTDSLDKATTYTSSVRRERGFSKFVDKENVATTTVANITTKSHQAVPSAISRLSSLKSLRTLKTRSSAPNLKTASSSTASKRHSMLFGAISPTLRGVQSFATPPIKVLHDDDKIYNTDTDEDNFYEDNDYGYELNSNSDDYYSSSSHTYSPYTPETQSGLDALFDQASIYVENDFESDFLCEESLENAKLNNDKRKTTVFKDINDFVKLIDESYNPPKNLNFVAINNRKSLDFEKLERNELRKSLQKSLERESATETINTTLKLVENAIFVGCDFTNDPDAATFILIMGEDYDNEAEYIGIFKDEEYETRDEHFYTTF